MATELYETTLSNLGTKFSKRKVFVGCVFDKRNNQSCLVLTLISEYYPYSVNIRTKRKRINIDVISLLLVGVVIGSLRYLIPL